MRMLMEVKMCTVRFNEAVRDGSAGKKIQRILDEVKPEAAYFTEIDGTRCGVIVVNMDNASQIPSLCEPWFQTFNAQVRLRPTMTPEDLAKANLDSLGKKWA